MKRSAIASTLAALMAIAGGMVDSIRPNHAQAQISAMFYCDLSGEDPVTRVRSSDGNVPVIIWKTDFFPSPYTPRVRCQQVSSRFRRFQEEGRLDFMTTGSINNQAVICMANSFGSSCIDDSDYLLMTLKPDDDPQQILEGLLDVRDFGSAPVQHYCPQVVYKSDDLIYIDVDELIQRKKLLAAGSCQPLTFQEK